MPSKTFLHRAAAIVAAVIASSSLSAQITFTVTGTVDNTRDGFTANDPVTFTYTLVQNPSPAFSGTATASSQYRWEDETIGVDTALWANVTAASPFTGTWSRPSTSSTSPYSYIRVQASNALDLNAGSSNYTDPTGLTFGANDVVDIFTSATFTGLSFDLSSGTLPDANTYFAALAGTYSLDTNHGSFFSVVGASDDIFFTPTSLTISAVPEPSTYAAFAGLAALGLVALRRRRAA